MPYPDGSTQPRHVLFHPPSKALALFKLARPEDARADGRTLAGAMWVKSYARHLRDAQERGQLLAEG
ncbi:g1027 [Coccomyxa viridis]|uniref:G1027 protein n=1 Tax=Coccomyxa viridis TaxID=1274662 RepID=A0ABP1FH23_9CHLO